MPPETRKNSNADYPVDPEERTSQQQRLRKAAAAGADALKAPMPSAMFRPPSSPVKPSEPQTPIAQSPSSVANPEASQVFQSLPEREVEELATSHNEEILAELRKISAWVETQCTITRWSLILVAVLVPALIGSGLFLEHRFQQNLDGPAAPGKPDWYDMDKEVRLGNFDKAIRIGEDLIQKTPLSPEAHQRLAGAYLASGDVERVREHFAEAFRLFPSEENERRLTAIEKRIQSEKQ